MSTTSAKPARAIIEAYVAALERGDESAIRDSFTEDAEWTLTGELPFSGTWRGRDVIYEEFLGRALASYAPGSVSFEVTELVADGDTAALEWITRGRSHAGARYENRYLGLFKIRDGRIASIREYLASAAAAHALFGSGPEAAGSVERR